ncbi:MAG TPA: GNAT family N-acetyltransferase [Candidatus Udaeobacter sp.]|jgi:lipid II:glycine glycyltransferase (peptidoglycan interpeptide bridge formation enzyme)|nr:GNAT family N-acetyltransferase [Candidatus Udaeobacter sp.]
MVPVPSSEASKPRQASITQNYRYRFVDPRVGNEWDRLAETHPDHEVFHSSAWARVLCNTYGHKPFYLHVSDENKTIALLPLLEVAGSLTGRRGVCLPFSDFCGPLLFQAGAEKVLIGELAQLAKAQHWKFFELRSGSSSQTSAVPSTTFYSHKIDLRNGPQPLFDQFAASVRRAIRKALKSLVVAEVCRTPESLSIFYRLHLRTRRRHGLPPQPFRFFRNIQKEIIEQGLGFIALAWAASRPIAAAVFFHKGDRALYKYAASDERYQRFRGSDLVLWQGIQCLCDAGAQTLHLGRTSLDNGGLRRFKLGWSVAEQMLYYFRFDVASNSWLNNQGLPGTWHKKLFGRLPLKLNQLAGTMIYPQLD